MLAFELIHEEHSLLQASMSKRGSIESITLQDIADAVRVDPAGIPRVRIRGISTDTRTLAPSSLFVALRGERFDGHHFLQKAVERGACAAIVENGHILQQLPAKFPLLRVPDTLEALGAAGNLYRKRSRATAIAITGSNGKTTVKTFAYKLFSAFGPTCASPKSFNNNIGVPLTLFRLTSRHEWVVLEMGTNHFGELKSLAEIAEPDICAITNISRTHTKFLRGQDGVAKAKAELIHALSPEGIAVLNRDDNWFEFLKGQTQARIVTFGLSPLSDVYATDIARTGSGFRFRVNARYEAELRLPCAYNVMNALAALAVAHACGLPLDELVPHLPEFSLPPLRMQRLNAGQVSIILDAYNANPASMRKSLAEFAASHHPGRKIAILGDMGELENSEEEHYGLGRWAASLPLSRLITVGQEMYFFCEAARGAGFPPDHIISFSSTEDAANRVPGLLGPGDLVFIKASRALELERVSEAIVAANTRKE